MAFADFFNLSSANTYTTSNNIIYAIFKEIKFLMNMDFTSIHRTIHFITLKGLYPGGDDSSLTVCSVSIYCQNLIGKKTKKYEKTSNIVVKN